MTLRKIVYDDGNVVVVEFSPRLPLEVVFDAERLLRAGKIRAIKYREFGWRDYRGNRLGYDPRRYNRIATIKRGM